MTAELVAPPGVATLLERGFGGQPCQVLGLADRPVTLPLDRWAGATTDDDDDLLTRCRGAVLDVGCGPGRMSARLAQLGHPSLGIDIVPHAVALTQDRGAAAQRRDVFDPLPAEGLWDTALLADGNIGIGGDPAALLRRLAELLTGGGQVVADVAGAGVPLQTLDLQLLCGEELSAPFPWAVVGSDAVARLAAAAGLAVRELTSRGSRSVAVLERAR
ncbi:class I SAM-dependent methyltransferase [Nocardioides sp. GXQ0305]|uniref:class I SAM-dependent methyltransferase n=1 Tax=Nocardioides sp. GXQ0305 TaxID=3423912 RepID=UPI003D7E4504